VPDAAQAAWERALDRLTDAAAATVLRVLASDALSPQERVGAAAAAIAAGQRRAVTAADVHLAAELAATILPGARPTGVAWMETADEQTARIAAAVEAVLTDVPGYVREAGEAAVARQSLAVRVNRLVDGQLVDAATWARGQAGQSHAAAGGIVGWVRRTDADPCRLCSDMRGTPPGVHPVTHRMAIHPGRDRCSQQFVSTLEGWGKWMGKWDEKPE
jgi:hypothetical protein